MTRRQVRTLYFPSKPLHDQTLHLGQDPYFETYTIAGLCGQYDQPPLRQSDRVAATDTIT